MTNNLENKNVDLQTLADWHIRCKKICDKQFDNMDNGYTVYSGLEREKLIVEILNPLILTSKL